MAVYTSLWGPEISHTSVRPNSTHAPHKGGEDSELCGPAAEPSHRSRNPTSGIIYSNHVRRPCLSWLTYRLWEISDGLAPRSSDTGEQLKRRNRAEARFVASDLSTEAGVTSAGKAQRLV
ncbi:hypothetical protein MPH_04815 [Macrophomina phaseolina MS6]|uniref:Uncharacterized protein n=1 Tax=Macrophomina phaseolina (strain MS6) TaxID=1126212 RepID=K2RT83_MACPH|nr:hypothetical protein MPH_04815 [Macrophomina phaseolina MS6]